MGKMQAENLRLSLLLAKAIADIKESDVLYECEHCAHRRMTEEEAEACERNDFECLKCEAECKCKSCRNGSGWEWRGVEED